MRGTVSIASVMRFSGFRRAASDLERSVDFYTHALGFVVNEGRHVDDPHTQGGALRDAPTRRVQLGLGREAIELFASVGFERHPGAGVTADAIADPAFHHLAIVTNNMGAALHRLERYLPTAISTGGPVQLPKAAGGVTAFKFRDPDGHPLELICFPPGVGHPRWQAPSLGPTLGIDHSAISVSNVAQSLALYVDALGFRLQSRQTNRGPEQARLDGADGAVVEVIGLAPSETATPHLELLGYRVPPPVRVHPLPALEDDRADRMSFVVNDLPTLVARLASEVIDSRSIDSRTLLLRDNDGHLLLLHQATLHSST